MNCRWTTRFASVLILGMAFLAGMWANDIVENVGERNLQWKRIGAFEGLVWQSGQPVVLLDRQWYVLEQINGWPIDQFLERTREHFGDATLKRFKEDLAEVLEVQGGMFDTIDVVLREPYMGELINRHGIEITEEKRRKTYSDRWKEQDDVSPPPQFKFSENGSLVPIVYIGC